MNEQQLAFKIARGGVSQADRVLECLQRHLDSWVGMPDLCRYSGSYNVHSRISDLRKRGCNIAQKTERQKDGSNHSFYKLSAP